MYVVVIEDIEPKNNLYYVDENSHTLSKPEVFRRFREIGTKPRLFPSLYLAQKACRKHYNEVARPAPEWVRFDELEYAMKVLEISSRILDVIVKING